MLLLVFPQVFTGWTDSNAVFTTWAGDGFDFKHLWSDWASTSWGTIMSSSYTWNYIQGQTFNVNTTTNVTVWANV